MMAKVRQVVPPLFPQILNSRTSGVRFSNLGIPPLEARKLDFEGWVPHGCLMGGDLNSV